MIAGQISATKAFNGHKAPYARCHSVLQAVKLARQRSIIQRFFDMANVDPRAGTNPIRDRFATRAKRRNVLICILGTQTRVWVPTAHLIGPRQ